MFPLLKQQAHPSLQFAPYSGLGPDLDEEGLWAESTEDRGLTTSRHSGESCPATWSYGALTRQ
jgi:hypothetical protein